MRIAVVSDIHGNRTAFEAVLADLRLTAPDLVLNGGDLADAGSSPIEIVDCVRDLAWPGVIGNTDEMLALPDTLDRFAEQSAGIRPLLPAIREMATHTRERLGETRLSWLASLPQAQIHGSLALVHASPASPWRSPYAQASDSELESVYGPLGQPVAAYGHIHYPYIRPLASLTVANSGSVSLSYDGDPRASYLLLDNGTPSIRRVAYDVDREIRLLIESRVPHAAWVAKTLLSASPQMP